MTNNTQPASDLTVTLPDRVIDSLFQSVGVSTYHPDGDQLDALHAFAHAVVAETLARLPAAPAQPPIGDVPADLHPATADLVQRFAAALAQKLAAAEKKYGYSDAWASPDWMDKCRADLLHHVAKGDPRDVAAYCAFLWHHGEKTAAPIGDVQLSDEQISELAEEHGLDVESALNFFHDCMATAPESALSAPRERQEPAKVLDDARDAARYRALRDGIDNGDEWIRIVGTLRGSGSLSLTKEHADNFIDRAISSPAPESQGGDK